jgi:site-specific DNA-methyltransferase (adenine-specific)
MTDTRAQKQAFADTWSNVIYIDEMNQIQDLDLDLFKFLKTMDGLKFHKGAVSYLTIMAHRIWHMHKKLKSTGSFYLHCDPNMSHYLKIVCDLIFDKKNFRNEIVWCYYLGGRVSQRNYGRRHDIILFYTKSDDYIFNWQDILEPWSEEGISKFRYEDEKGKYRLMGRFLKGSPIKGYRDISPEWEKTHPELVYRHYLKEGKMSLDYWNISPINQVSEERLGYATQKPEALLERIIKASSNKKDTVADFFCGCGSTIAVAQKLDRKWIGVDISHLAIRLIYDRLLKPFEGKPKAYNKIRTNIEINGFPKDLASAHDLAEKTDKGRIKFQDWVIEIMMNGVANPKKVGDGGYDGYIAFNKSEKEKDIILIEVKNGKCGLDKLRSFIATVNHEKVSLGAFVCFKEYVTHEMERLAKQQGCYKPDLWGNKYDRIQIISIEDLLAGKNVKYPLYQNITFKTATNISIIEENNQNSLFE